MKKSLILSVVAALMIAAVSVGLLQAQKVANQKNVIYVAAAHAKFDQTQTAGVTMATVWGDPDKGAPRNLYEVRAWLRLRDAYTYERAFAGCYQGRLSLQG